jgi:hypothetical protein
MKHKRENNVVDLNVPPHVLTYSDDVGQSGCHVAAAEHDHQQQRAAGHLSAGRHGTARPAATHRCGTMRHGKRQLGRQRRRWRITLKKMLEKQRETM